MALAESAQWPWRQRLRPGQGPPEEPPPRCSMLSPGPPPALHRRAARLQPARPLGAARRDPAPPPRRPPRGRPRPAGVGGAARGRGPRGVPAPGARPRASTPRHACPAGRTLALHSRTQDPSLPDRVAVCLGVRSAQDSAAAAGHPLLQPWPRDQWRLVIVGAQRAWRRDGRPTPSALLVEASLPGSPASESRVGC